MRLTILQLPAVVFVAASLLVAAGTACGGSDTGAGAGSTPQVQTKPGSGKNAPRAAADVNAVAEIDQKNLTFIPAQVTVKVGETVLIKNSESAIHTGNVNGKNITGNMKKGDTVPWVAKEPGEYKVTCDYHPQMKSTIVVTAS
jgi:plastocyanin